ncbi:ribosomal protein L31E [Enterocytozoon bieneusi H348]|nr:ribosomal protein L31E [Enterocytozoon bieneusi H348]|eukprot:XP_002649709.1 ribosomal protein L31E [Enterocytozoon bieneusi H348]
MSDATGSKINEITINARKLALGCKSNRKASSTVKNLKKFIQKQWKTTVPVYISTDLNKILWSRGNFKTVGRVRVRVEKSKCIRNPEEDCLKVSLVDVSSFKKLKDIIVMDNE